MVAVMLVALTTVTPVAAVPPKVTVAPATKSAPVMVTAVPPAVGPLVGLTPVTVGGGGGAPQEGNLKEPMRVLKSKLPLLA